MLFRSRLAMPTAQARMTRARGLHAIRSSIRSGNDASSLPERRVACRFFLFRWHRAHMCHPLKVRTATSTDRWRGSQARMSCAPCHGHMCASGGAAGRGCHTPAWLGSARFARSSYVNRALFGISTSADRWPQFWRCMPCVSYHRTQLCVGGVAEGCNTGAEVDIPNKARFT